MKFHCSFRNLHVLVLLLSGALCCQAQWRTQSLNLKQGWNAVYLFVDGSYDTLDNLIGSDTSNPIQEVWLWSPQADASFVQDIETPSQPNHWLHWSRIGVPAATLSRLTANAACFVRVNADYTWNWKGKPVVPHHEWTGSGLNFLGFPTIPGSPPTFGNFLPDLMSDPDAEIFGYLGGGANFGGVKVTNPNTLVPRGQAYWIRSKKFYRYFGPIETVFGSSDGISFGEAGGQFSFRLRNHSKTSLTVKLELLDSELPPAAQPTILGTPPLLVRGPINLTNLTYTSTPLTSPYTVALAADGQPGSDIEVVVGLNRAAMNLPPGGSVAGVLRITDSLGYSQIEAPVSATMSSTAGLWVGNASVTSVNQYLTSYYTATNNTDATNLLTTLGLLPATNGITYLWDSNSQRIIKFDGTNGLYLAKQNNNQPASVAQPYPLRLIIHNDAGAGRATLFQRVYVGDDTAGNHIVASAESALDPKQLGAAHRISAAHLPWRSDQANTGWLFSGPLGMSADITLGPLKVSYDDQASNPFLHTYHPDHDNLDAQFKTPLQVGEESYGVERTIRLVFGAPANDFSKLTTAGTQLTGQYFETIKLIGRNNAGRSFDVSGRFVLNRISPVATLSH